MSRERQLRAATSSTEQANRARNAGRLQILEEKERDLREKAEALILKCQTPDEREMLRMRYLMLMDWATIARVLYHRIVSSCLGKAVKWGYIPYNPAVNAELPKMPKQEAAYLDEAEARQLLVLLHQEPIKYRAMITFDLLSGLRRGELLGLRWQDVDFENQTITIVNTLNYAPGAGVYVDTPKNTTSARPLKLSPTAFSMLLEYKRWQDDQRDACGDYWKDTVGRVFTGDDGAPVFPDSLTKWFAAFVKRSGLPDVHIHSLRHTYASLMIADGTPLPVVSRRLGHAQVSTTANIYAHAIASADEKAAQIAEKFADVVTTPEDCQATGKRKSPAKRRGRLELVG